MSIKTKRNLKKISVFLLVIIMITQLIMTKTNIVLADELFDEVENQNNNNGCKIFEITMEENSAIVSFETRQDAILIVGIYEEDGSKILASGIKDVMVGETNTLVDIEAELPQYYLIKGFLVDTEDYSPLCTSYESSYYANEKNDYQTISLGSNHSGAITKEGELYMWGYNYYGQLGDGSYKDSTLQVKVLEEVKSISLGQDYSTAITEEGDLYMWGYNEERNLGNYVNSNVPIKIMEGVKSVSLGSGHNGVITEEGDLYMWGSNNHGQLGNGSMVDGEVPIKVLEGIKSVSLGSSHSAIVTEDGDIYMWGRNKYGQLGNGSKEDSEVPIKVVKNIQLSNTSTYDLLIPEKEYLFYAIKSEEGNILTSDNLLYIAQGKADSDGKLTFAYNLTEDIENVISKISDVGKFDTELIVNKDENITVNYGKNQELNVIAETNLGRTIEYQWYLYDDETWEYNKIDGATDSKYLITNVKKDASYKCVVTDGIVEKEVYFNIILNSDITYEWKQNENGWWYEGSDGSYPKNEWKCINGRWYHFDANGYMQTGWYKEGTKYYYLKSNGVMASAEFVEDGKYYINSNGVWETSTKWLKIDNKYYYIKSGEVQKSKWLKVGAKYYYFDATGVMQSNKWIQNKYYVKSDGSMAVSEFIGNYYVDENGIWVTGTKWINVNNKYYYIKSGTVQKSKWLKVGTKYYYFDAAGVMQANKWIQNKYYVKSDGSMAVSEFVENGKYYVDENGIWVTGSKWLKVNNNWYYILNGIVQQSKWTKIGTKYYYFDAKGVMQSSKWINGTYYVKADGSMAVSEWVDNGKYYVGSDGKWVEGA